uniref:Uncharacterized protein n=1 Tax=Arundo donax TaxID=35708 RepID=A0A0A9GTQ4_ARUDO
MLTPLNCQRKRFQKLTWSEN